MAALTIEVTAAPQVNHAMAHNGLPFLHRIVVRSADPGAEPLTDVRLSARVVDTFGTVLSRPWQHFADRLETSLVVDQPALRLDPVHLAEVEEETAAEIVVEVGVAGTAVVVHSHPIRVLAARQWVLDPDAPVLSLELLAAFVQPNHPAVASLVAGTARALAEASDSGSLATQHAAPDRIDAIVDAVVTAVHDLGIYYAEPPASWGYGQKVRNPGDVLTDRVGTCLDTTVLIASTLEQIGIQPVIWVARGHAFLGYWRRPDRGLPDAATSQIATAANAVDLELMGLLETTMVTRERRPPRDLARRARQAPRDAYFIGGTAELLGVVDVAMARLMQVHPLPARRLRPDGVVEVVEYVPPTPTPAAAAGEADPVAAGRVAGRTRRPDQGPPVPARVQAWKNALLDLTLRNKLLNLGQPMTQAPLLLPPEHLDELARLLQDGRSVAVRAVDDLSGAVVSEGARDAYALPADVQRVMLTQKSTVYSGYARKDHERAFDRLRYRARTGRAETGANPLMLTLGRLDWQLGDRALAAPLLLLPVDVKGIVMPYRIAADPAGGVTLNLSLMEKLRVEFGFRPGLEELPMRPDADGVDVGAVVRRFREALAESGLAFRVESEARLLIGGFTGFLLWRDLDEHWGRFVERPLVQQLLTGRLNEVEEVTEPAPARLDEIVAAAPVPADGSQAKAIAAARAGHSFVLEGPPGTGKSQTITNLLADQLAQGRRVLFVAEKGAALDVVRKRLSEVGLLPYALDLHDHNARPAEVRAKLRTALALRTAADQEGHRAALADLSGSTAALRGYAERLHRRNRAGLSLWSARATALARGAGPSLTVPPGVLGAPGVELDDLRRVVAAAADDLAALDADVVRGWGFAGPTDGDAGPDPAAVFAALPAADAAVAAAVRALAETTPDAARLLGRATSGPDLEQLTRLLGTPVPGHELAELGTERWAAARAELGLRTDGLQQLAAPVLTDFGPEVLDVDLETVRQELRVAEHSFFLGRRGRLLRAAGPVLARLQPGREIRPKDLPQRVEGLVALAQQQHTVAAGWRALPGLTGLPLRLNLLSASGRQALAAALTELDGQRAALEGLGPVLAADVVTVRQREPHLTPGVRQRLAAAADGLAAVFAATGSRPRDQRAYAADGLLTAWTQGAAARAADAPHGNGLRRWVRAATAVEALSADLPAARWQLLSGETAAADAVGALERGLAAGSLAERWDAGGFRGFDGAGQDRSVDRFLTAGAAVRSALRTVLPAALIEARPFGTGALFGRVAALEREVGRSRGGLSVRALISTYGEVIAAVTPCVLVSPDSLARFIAPDAMDFDLVVFDEASQITVPDAIGALGRAAGCVIAGDSKQMPPSTFAQLSEEEQGGAEEDFVAIPDEESILSECVQAGLPRLWLSWHYRSRDESLIDFSNNQYYEGRLSTFPAFPGGSSDTGVSFTRVPGTFLRSGRTGTERGLVRTNPVEAAAVVAEVLRRWQGRERSIGVVTFNIQQRALVEKMLWDSEVEGVREALAAKDGGLFVKNLENVQGDEREVVIFSTGFSVGADGVLPLNFGPLNRTGGERRLNVAVTRARRRVLVFSSFEPEDLRVEQTSSVGVKHLRAYLELAKYGVPDRVRTDTAIDRHAEELATALRAAGCTVTTQVGLSEFRIDLAVAAPGRDEPSLAVLLDGPAWAARATTVDRDGAPVSVLGDMMGWPGVARVWLPDWLADPGRIVARLATLAEEAADRPRPLGETTARADASGPDEPVVDEPVVDEPGVGEPVFGEPVQMEQLAAGPPRVAVSSAPSFDHQEPYVESDLGPYPTATLERLDADDRARRAVTDTLLAIIDESGPIGPERLARRLVKAYGRSRLVDGRVAQLGALVPGYVHRDTDEGFYWPARRDPLEWRGFRSSADPKLRPLADVALVEIANAMASVAARAMGIGEDELFKQTYRLFGGSRLSDPARERMARALAVAVRRERLAVRGGVVTAL